MLNETKQYLKKFLKRRGWAVERYRPYRDKFELLVRLCADHHCDTLIDIGANEGQFALDLLEAGYRGEIISIEPQATPHQKLEQRAAAWGRWRAAPRMCMGERNGTAAINIAANSVSSSILDVLDTSTSANADTRYIGREDVAIRRLDDWADDEAGLGTAPIGLKLDVQGYEQQVLAGAERLLPAVRVLILEMSLSPLYEGSATFSQLFTSLEDIGFSPSGIFPGFSDTRSLRMLQVDGVFERSGKRR